MNIVILESQYQRLIETEEEQGVLEIPNLRIFGKDRGDAWMRLQELLEKRGNPPYSIGGNLVLFGLPIKSLGNLTSVRGYLDLNNTPIKSLGNLQYVGGDLYLNNTQIESLGNLKSVGGDLSLRQTQVYKTYTGKKIRQMIKVGGYIYL